MSFSKPAKSSGFTLIEVMVALAIFAVSMTALTTTFQTNVTNAALLKNKTLAHWLAQNKMVEMKAQLIAKDVFPQVTDRNDKVEFAGREWVVKTKVSKSPKAGFQIVEISVGEDASGDPYFFTTLQGYLSDPS